MYLGDFAEDGDLFFKFTTRAFATGIPTTLTSGVLSVYKDEGGAATEKTTAETYFDLDLDHDSIGGWNNVRIDLSGDAFFATGADYSIVITTGTVDSVSVVGENIANFSIENRSMGQPAGATLAADVAALKAETALIVGDTVDIQTQVGTAGAGLTNINLPNQTMDIVGDITGNLSGSVGSVTGAVGSVTGAVGSVTGHTNQTGDTFALANGVTGFAAIDTVVDSILVDTGTTIPDILEGLVLISKAAVGATGNTTTVVHLATGTGTYSDDELNGFFLVLLDSGATEYHVREITGFANTGDLATVATLPFTPATDDFYWLLSAQAGNNIAATDIVSNGAITTLSGAIVNVDLVDTLTTYTGNTLQTIDAATLNDVAATDIVSSGAITTLAGAVVNVDLTDTLTTYTGNTLQTGDVTTAINDLANGTDGLGAIKAETAAIKAETALIVADTDVIDDGTSGLVKIASDVAAILVDTGTTIPDTLEGLVLVSKASVGATGNTTTVVHLATGTGSYADDELNGFFLVLFDNGTSEYHVREITGFANTGDLATVATLPFTPATDDFYWLLSAQAGSTAATVATAVWDRDATSNQTTGTFGAAIGDPAANTETIYDAVVTDATGINVATDVVAVKAETVLIVADTNELQVDDIPTLIATVTTDLDDIKGTSFVKDTHSLIDIETYVDILDDGTSGNVKIATDVAATLVDTAVIGALGAGLTDLGGMSTTMKGQVNTEVDGSMVTYGLDHLVSASVIGTDVTDNSIIAKLVDDAATADWDGYDPTTASLEALNVDADAIKAETALIVADTDVIDDGTSGLVKIATDVAAVLVDTAVIGAGGAGLTAVPWNAAWDAEVESEVNDALDTAISELGVAAPTATPTVRTALMLMYMALRNKLVVQTSGTDALELKRQL